LRPALALFAVVAACLAVAGCGSSSTTPAGFAWVQASATPAGWHQVRIPAGDAISFPPGWRPIRTDHGTASRALLGSHGQFVGYLNLTPSVPQEKLRTWARFRVDHNGDENDTHVRALASGRGLHFAGGQGACVRDGYMTESSAHFIEIACLIVGQHRSVVGVGAAPPEAWHQVSAQLERALASIRT
jgi:hypothetical protein